MLSIVEFCFNHISKTNHNHHRMLERMAAPFAASSRKGDSWVFVGITSGFPNLDLDGASVSELRHCRDGLVPGCKVFEVPRTGASSVAEFQLEDLSLNALKNQVLIFQYKGKFHAIDHVRPESPSHRRIPFANTGTAMPAFIIPIEQSYSF
jgi:hypothetical protein